MEGVEETDPNAISETEIGWGPDCSILPARNEHPKSWICESCCHLNPYNTQHCEQCGIDRGY